MNESSLHILMIILAICCFVCFRIGQTRPDKKTRDFVREELRKEQVQELVTGKIWTRTEIIWNYPGPLGSEIQVMILDCGVERTSIMYGIEGCSFGNGDKIVLRMRNKHDAPKHVWINSVDKYCIPCHPKDV